MENTERYQNTQTPFRYGSSHLNDDDELLPMVGITSSINNCFTLFNDFDDVPERCKAPETHFVITSYMNFNVE